MKYDFDVLHNRRNSLSIKHNLEKYKKSEETLPLWVADMDFQSPIEVREALVREAEHGIFGYSGIDDAYLAAVAGWQKENFQWDVESEWLVTTSGVVNSIAIAILSYTQPGDKIIIQQPVYYPFFETIKNTGRIVVNSPLTLENGHYEIDFEDFEKQIMLHTPKMFILCSPHNPVGRVWTKEELETLGDICIKHNVLVFSDEIHQDFVFVGQHTPFASIKPAFSEHSITSTAPSKTFNLPGLHAANIYIPSETLRKKFTDTQGLYAAGGLNIMGIVACRAAYTYGKDWLEQLKEYLLGTTAYIRNYLQENIPGIKLIEPEGTYLLWFDCRGLGLSHEALETLINDKAKLWLDGGTMFGPEGEGFQRVNIGSPRRVLKEAMERLNAAVKEL
ncbi:MAG: MalY/PatB family protein [Christensenellaceae bacterium]